MCEEKRIRLKKARTGYRGWGNVLKAFRFYVVWW
jgi:hypothetical protein